MTEAQWYFMDRRGQRQGPVAATAFPTALEAGEIGPEDLVWCDGMDSWRPLKELANSLGLALPATTSPPPPPPPPPRTSAPGLRRNHHVDAPGMVYAGFWRRFAALFLDQFILGTAFYAVVFTVIFLLSAGGVIVGWDENQLSAWVGGVYLAFFLVYYIAAGAYYSLQESSANQATIGKRAMSIKVVDLDGNRLSLGKAIGRWFAAFLSYLTFYIGFLTAAFTERKQALHDMVAGTLVVDKWAYTEHPELQAREASGCLIGVIVAALLALGLCILSILLAIAIPAYQDYVVRAKIDNAISIAAPVKLAVDRFHERNGTCPVNGDAGIKQPQLYATEHVVRIDTGAMQENDWCAVQLTLRNLPAVGADGQRVWLELDPTSGRWRCSSEIADKYLSAHCRGWNQ